jgi:Zn-dependent M28 family amino/carboxypeptidase
MLEAARALAHSGCSPSHSIIFVAFDLEEVGSQGSLVFIKEFLSQMLKDSEGGLRGKVDLSRFQVRKFQASGYKHLLRMRNTN